MRRSVRATLLGALLALAIALAPASPATAQDPTSSTTTTVAVPSQDIVPQPNSGAPPAEAGDRGGALQLTILALVVLGIGGAVVTVVRQSRRARGQT